MQRIDYDFLLLADYLDCLRTKLRIAVIFSGDPDRAGSVIHRTHNPRSWQSYQTVATDIQDALQESGFENVCLLPEDKRLACNLERERIDLAWLNTGGAQGYDPMCHAPGMLEMLGIPYVGHSPLNSATLDNKRVFKLELRACGIPTSPFLSWDCSRGVFNPRGLARQALVFEGYDGPFVVKPVSGRASHHVRVVDSIDELPRAVSEIHRKTAYHVVIERYLSGPEYCVAVAGPVTHAEGRFTKAEMPFAFSVVERVFEKGERIFTSTDEKRITPKRAHLLEGDPATKATIIALAQQIYRDLALETLVRVDLRADTDGNIFVLECNPKPDLRKPSDGVTSLVALGLPEHQMTYNDLIVSLLADRLDYLLTHRSPTIQHVFDLLS